MIKFYSNIEYLSCNERFIFYNLIPRLLVRLSATGGLSFSYKYIIDKIVFIKFLFQIHNSIDNTSYTSSVIRNE